MLINTLQLGSVSSRWGLVLLRVSRAHEIPTAADWAYPSPDSIVYNTMWIEKSARTEYAKPCKPFSSLKCIPSTKVLIIICVLWRCMQIIFENYTFNYSIWSWNASPTIASKNGKLQFELVICNTTLQNSRALGLHCLASCMARRPGRIRFT